MAYGYACAISGLKGLKTAVNGHFLTLEVSLSKCPNQILCCQIVFWRSKIEIFARRRPTMVGGAGGSDHCLHTPWTTLTVAGAGGGRVLILNPSSEFNLFSRQAGGCKGGGVLILISSSALCAFVPVERGGREET